MNILSSDCVVCSDPETLDNLIYCCRNCDVSVHVLCYGFNGKKRLNYLDCVDWRCSPCSAGVFNPVCELCGQAGGALKSTTCAKWVHIICALFTEGVTFIDVTKMEPVDITGIPEANRQQKCVLCEKSNGICCSCARKDCTNWMHVTCAQKHRCLKEENDKNDKIAFRAYCLAHKSAYSSRRISSIFVQRESMERLSVGDISVSEGNNGAAACEKRDFFSVFVVIAKSFIVAFF